MPGGLCFLTENNKEYLVISGTTIKINFKPFDECVVYKKFDCIVCMMGIKNKKNVELFLTDGKNRFDYVDIIAYFKLNYFFFYDADYLYAYTDFNIYKINLITREEDEVLNINKFKPVGIHKIIKIDDDSQNLYRIYFKLGYTYMLFFVPNFYCWIVSNNGYDFSIKFIYSFDKKIALDMFDIKLEHLLNLYPLFKALSLNRIRNKDEIIKYINTYKIIF